MKKLSKAALFIALMTNQVLFAQVPDSALEYKKSNYRINAKMSAGNFMIYNCTHHYYTCVDEASNELCKNARKEAIANNHSSYPCAPLKKFNDKKECLVKNYSAVEKVAFKRFCYPK